MKKIKIYALHLGAGGVENYLISLANILSKDHDVSIISTYKVSNDPFFELSDNVKITYLIEGIPTTNELKKSIRRFNIKSSIDGLIYNTILLFKKYLLNIKNMKNDDSDIVITSRIFHNRLVGKYISNSYKVATEHNYHNNDNRYINDLIKSLKGFDYLLPISKELTTFYKNRNELNKLEVMYIPFYVDQVSRNSDLNTFGFQLNYIYIGRLSSEKGVLDLIEVFNCIYKLNKAANLTIVGDGDLYDEIVSRIREYHLEGSIYMKGFQSKKEINELLENSTFLLLTSYTESFGIVLLEAMSKNVIPIIFTSATGAVEILEGIDCCMIDDRSFDEMAKRSIEIFNDKNQLQNLSKVVKLRSEFYSIENMTKEWKDFVEERLK